MARLGGNPLTVEENYLFQKLMREGAGVNHIDHRMGMPIFSLEEEGIATGNGNVDWGMRRTLFCGSIRR